MSPHVSINKLSKRANKFLQHTKRNIANGEIDEIIMSKLNTILKVKLTNGITHVYEEEDGNREIKSMVYNLFKLLYDDE